jgi:hypothetical protein
MGLIQLLREYKTPKEDVEEWMTEVGISLEVNSDLNYENEIQRGTVLQDINEVPVTVLSIVELPLGCLYTLYNDNYTPQELKSQFICKGIHFLHEDWRVYGTQG